MARILLFNMCAKVLHFIKENISDPEFLRNHKKSPHYFTRERHLTFETVFMLILSTFSSSLRNLVSRMYDTALDFPAGISSSAICQSKQKISFSAFMEICEKVSKFFYEHNEIEKWEEFRLVAVDGSQINLPENDETEKLFGKIKNSTGETLRARASVLYDVMNEIVISGQMMPFAADEISMLMTMTDSLKAGDLLLADRFYPSFYVFKYLLKNGVDFCFRISTAKWKMVRKFVESGKEEEILLIHPSVGAAKKCISNKLDDKSLGLRFVKVMLESGETEVLVTSLCDMKKYPADLFSDLYMKRWGVETFYKTLKESMSLEKFSSVKNNGMLQDFYAKLLVNNLTRMFSVNAQKTINKIYKKRKLKYKVNHTSALGFLKNKFANMFYGNTFKLLRDLWNFLISGAESFRPGRKYERTTPTVAKSKKAIAYKPL